MDNILNNQQYGFVKYHGEQALRDWKRVNLLFRYASNTQGVLSPKPLSLDSNNQTIVYEFIDGIKPSFHVLDKNINKAIILGHALARFHHTAQDESHQSCQQHLLSLFDLTQKEIDFVIQQLPCAFFIGDAWHGNMFFHPNNDIILLDPLPNQCFFPCPTPNYASSLLDIATLYMSFFVCHSLLDYARLNKIHLQEMATKVIEAYVEYYGDSRLLPLIRKVGKRIALIHIGGYKNRIIWPFNQIKSLYGSNIISTMLSL